MAQYLILIYSLEEGFAGAPSDVRDEIGAGHAAFAQKYGPAILGGNALQPTGAATSVRPDGADGFTVTDGPFVETKEALAGYYLVEANDLDAAVAMAKDVPSPFGGLEVRPIAVLN